MKPLLILAAVILAVVAFFGLAFATVPRESKVAMHLFSDDEFTRTPLSVMNG